MEFTFFNFDKSESFYFNSEENRLVFRWVEVHDSEKVNYGSGMMFNVPLTVEFWKNLKMMTMGQLDEFSEVDLEVKLDPESQLIKFKRGENFAILDPKILNEEKIDNIISNVLLI